MNLLYKRKITVLLWRMHQWISKQEVEEKKISRKGLEETE